MKFKTKYDTHARVHQNPGNPIKVIYSPRYSERGVLDLEPIGEENLYDYIQSHAQSVDIHVILERFASGETDVLSQIQGFYADASNMPKTYAEVLNAVIAGEQAFDHLPIEVKQQFDNSFAVWMAAMDQPDFAKRMGFEQPQSSETNMTDQQVQDFAGDAAAPSPVLAGFSGVAGAVAPAASAAPVSPS